MKTFYQIQYSGTSATITTEFLAKGTTEAQAIAIAQDYKADLWKGFISLREVRDIRVPSRTEEVVASV